MKNKLFLAAIVITLLITFLTSTLVSHKENSRLLIVSAEIDNAEALIKAASGDVEIITIDQTRDSLQDILSKARSVKYSSIGLALHDYGEGKFYLTANHTVSLASLKSRPELAKFWQDLGSMVEAEGNIDIFACNLYNGPAGQELVASLQELTGVNINASSNETGNADLGGDWLLERGDRDLTSLYFVDSLLDNYDGLLVSEVKKLIPPDSVEGMQFGSSVAISGDTAVVGRNYPPLDGNGALYIYSKDKYGTSNWGLTRIIKMPPSYDFKDFGKYVTLDGDMLATTAITSLETDEEIREIFIYKKDEGGEDNWGLIKRLASPDLLYDYGFGYINIVLDGDFLAVSDIWDDETADNSGATYLFHRNKDGSNAWGLVKKFKDDFPEADAYWGNVLDLDNNLMVVRNYDHLGGDATGPGSVELFFKDQLGQGAWGRLKRITLVDGANGDRFGWKAALSGEFLAVSASHRDDRATDSGAVYIYQKNRGGTANWGLLKKISPADLQEKDYFGTSISLDGGTLIVGASMDDNNKGENAGALYIFHKDKGGTNVWGQVSKFLPADGFENQEFAQYAQVSGDVAIVGVPLDNPSGDKSGSAYVVDVSQSGTLKGVVRPTRARKAGGKWSIEGREEWYDHLAKITLPPGEYTLKAKPLEGYKVKRVSKVTVKANGIVRGRVVYAPIAATSDEESEDEEGGDDYLGEKEELDISEK